ncbi:DNA repair protein xrcc3 [Podila humilis]|nr:DNA repair protein xrcc3 [Podila humilis]
MTSINVLDLPESIVSTLTQASLDTVEDLMLYVSPSIVNVNAGSRFKRHQPFKGAASSNYDRLMNLTVDEIAAVYNRAAEYIVQHRVSYGTALDLLHEESWLSMGDPVMDQAMGGRGIVARGITEIAGESAVGKTQMCLQLCLMALLPKDYGGLDGSVVWLSTEGKFPYSRLEALIGHFVSRYSDNVPGLTPESIRANIHFDSMADQETQLHIFNYQLPVLIEREHLLDSINDSEGVRRRPVRLVIIDSITNNFRSELTVPVGDSTSGSHGAGTSLRTSMLQRSTDICEIGIRLRALADEYALTVVCVNQVTDVFKPESRSSSYMTRQLPVSTNRRSGLWKPEGGDRKKPALGLVWENTINARVMLQRTRVVEQDMDGLGSAPELEPHRSMLVMFSPSGWAASDGAVEDGRIGGYCEYRIDGTGVHGIPAASDENGGTS